MRARLATDFARFGRELPRDFAGYVRQAYRIDLTARYLGYDLPHPFGKGSGQLSLNTDQLETDRAAGLAFVVLKTLIAETASGERTMGAWAIHETRMAVERRLSLDGREGWTVTWKGRGWDRSLSAYLELVRAGRDLTRAGPDGMLVVPSVKYHLPRLDEPFVEAEYAHTTAQLAAAWGDAQLPIEKDFSPTLAGDPLADERAQVLRWIGEVPGRIRRAAPHGARVQLKLMNARFDDAFQVEMLAAARDADGVTGFNRLFDAERRVAYGGWDLSDRNLRVLHLAAEHGVARAGLSATGNICSGRALLDYARRGCESCQLHTFFQLPLSEYPATAGSRIARALHALVFHPTDGLIAGMLELEEQGVLARHNGELRFLDLASMGNRSGAEHAEDRVR
ncbi:MAG TPA: hypothetical protein VE091_04805 [Gemmatimonadales bacterium]|nr:hypothetical protein [Gemmatimonadales bacterium]